ncbi:unnamed protein product [Diabrotica balteata]|uniref:Uncharacterized protein n=1 Tax=Diabrotica balteata TaxID=107213 RepID=A0A9N9T163_DIABA|nr:unnamed protein product [Diabrotica balteata]
MKVVVSLVLFNFISTISTQTRTKSNTIPAIVRQTFDITPEGTYNYAFETENEIYLEEEGHLDNEGKLTKQGQYQYTGPNGEIIRTIYTADEEGFHPQGAHLPTAPPLPPASFSFSNWP